MLICDQKHWKKRDLLHSIYITGKSSATDKRDKVYGVLGLAYDAERVIRTPKYCLSTEEVYKSFAVSWVREYATLEFLSLAGLPGLAKSFPSFMDARLHASPHIVTQFYNKTSNPDRCSPRSQS